MIPAPVARLAQHPAGSRTRALAVLVALLDGGWVGADWRRVKLSALAHTTPWSEKKLSPTLRWLVAHGSLERRRGPDGLEYRVPHG